MVFDLFDRSLSLATVVAAVEEYSQNLTGVSRIPEKRGTRGRKKQSRAKGLLDRCRTYQQEILRFMKDFTISFTNNQAERDLRVIKVKQKTSGTFRSEEGAMNFCRARGFISTAKRHGRPALSELRGVFERTPFVPTAAHRVP